MRRVEGRGAGRRPPPRVRAPPRAATTAPRRARHFAHRHRGYGGYALPELFSEDWLNGFYDARPELGDDYRSAFLAAAAAATATAKCCKC